MNRFRAFLASILLASSAAHAADKPFDPTRDPAKDLAAAEQIATREHKSILIDAGGNWCGWCMVLDKLMHTDKGLHQELEDHYVVLHVNWSPDNPNTAFFAKYPKVNGYPYFFVLNSDGKLLKGQSTDEFEADHSLAHGYDTDKLIAFLRHWSRAGAA